ncbi:MAG: putative Ig domain-containing protein [Acidobacteriota bacterium]
MKRNAVFACLVTLLVAFSAHAVTHDLKVVLDIDRNAATGCTVTTPAGTFAGAEQVLNTRVDVSGGTATTFGVTRQACVGGIVGSVLPVDSSSWPAGLTPAGDLFIETHVTPAELGLASVTPMRIAFFVTAGALNDAVMATPSGNPLVWPHPGRHHAVSPTPAPPRTITLDGLDGDWAGIPPVAGGGGGTADLRILNGYAFGTMTNLFFAVRLQANHNAPTAVDDAYSLETVGGTLNIDAGSGVLANDSDPNSLPLSAVLIAGVQHGTLTLNANGSFTYANDGSNAPIDTFEYKASNGTLLSNAAQVQIGIGAGSGPPPPPTPKFTSADHTTFNAGEFSSFTVTTTPLHPTVHITSLLSMPPGVTLVDNGNGTATMSGTPPYGSGGVYQFGLKATNVVGSAIQVFTLTINETATPPVITSANSVNLQAGAPANFVVTTSGFPDPAITRSGALPTGVTFTDNNNGTATIGGTPANGSGGTYPLLLTATNAAGTATQNFTIIVCNGITVTNPATTTGTAGAAFSQNFTQSGAVGTATFTLNSGVLPTGLTLAANGTLSGTPTVTGSFPITVRVTDSLGCTAVGAIYSLIINCQTITVTNPATTTGTAGAAFSQTFTQSGAIGGATFTTASTLPAGLTLSTAGVLSGTPTQTGTFPIVVTVTDGNGCTGNGATYNLVINCQTITVTNPATTTGTAGAAFSQTFTQSGAIGGATFTTASTLPAGLTLSTAGVLSGTPTQTGTFPIVVTVTDGNGCTGNGATYNLVINCQTITVTNPATTTGTAAAPFSQTFTQTGAIGGATFTTASTLPTGLTLSTAGVLSGTPTQTGTFPIVVTVTDGNGCTGNGATYNLVINCQTITVTNPATTTGTAAAPFSQTFTQTGAIGGATFTTASTLPTGLTLSTAGVLSGTPTQNGTFPIVVTVTDSNGCTGTGATYTLVVNCQVITVTNPVVSSGTAGTAFSETFTQTGALGGATFTTASALPTGLTLSTAGVLSGTPTQTGTFPIVVTVTDGNGCTGSGPTYNLVIGCQVITVNNPATTTGTANSAFSETFTATNAIGTQTFTTASTLPAGLTLATNGTLSGTPTQTGTFPIVVMVTDGNGCTGTGATYNLVIGCQVITVNNPASTTGTVNSPFSETFTATNAIGATTFATASTLPAGLTLATNGVLSGTPTQTGTFPIVVTVTDANGCPGTGATYNLVIGCQVITVNNPANNLGTVNAPFSETFTQSGAIGSATFTTASTLPTGITLSTAGLLSGTPMQPGTFPIVVTVTDANGCTGNGATYNLIIVCQTITVNNPATTNSPAGTPLSINFTQTGAIGGATFTTASTLPTGLSLATDGTLSGTPTQGGTFPIVVTVTDGNGCTGTNPAYSLTINCPVITVTNPVNTAGTVGAVFSETFTQAGGQGTITFTTLSTLPTGLALSTAGVLSGTPSQFGTFPIVVTATDQNGCIGTGPTYTLVISCGTITVTNPGVTTGTVDAPFSQSFGQTGAFGTATFTTLSALPAGLTLSTAGLLSGTPTVNGTFPIVVTVTDSAGCTGTGSTYTLVINCQTINVTNPGVTTGTVDAPFSQTFTQTGAHGTATFTTVSTLPAGLTLSTAGVLSGTPTVNGTFPIVVTVTDSNGCTGTGATYTLVINCQTITVTNPGVTTGTVGVAFSQQFTQTGAHGTATFTTASTLPTGFTLSTSGLLSGTTMQHTTFPIVVTVTDSNGCTGTSATYNLVINCQTITVTNPGVNTGTVGAPFSQQFTESGSIGGANFTTASTLPLGVTLSTAGLLAGTPTQSGSFPIVVTVTDGNGCTGTNPAYTLIIACNVITVTNPGIATGTINSAFSQTFTQSGGNGTITWSLFSGTLPTGLSLSTGGVLSGTPTQTTAPSASFPIVVRATDANGCFGDSATYNLTINCQTITVNNPATNTGTRGTAFSQTFTASNTIGTLTFSTVSTLPIGLSLATNGTLSGTPTQHGVFNIIVSVNDANGCGGSGATYQLTIACQVITVTNPGVSTGTFNVPFSQTFTQTGAIGGATFTTASTLPLGITLSTGGLLSGTPTQTGTFPIVVTVTDGDTPTGCTGTSATYNLAINPVATSDSYANLVDNTQAVVISGATTSPATPFVSFAFTGRLIANDTPSGGVTANAGTVATAAGGSVTIAADGTFIYTPKVNSGAAITTADSFTYTISSNTGGTATPTTANATATLTLANRVWYVRNNAGGGGNGQSQAPFNTLGAAQGAAIGSTGPNFDHIFVYNGDGTNTNQNAGITLNDGQKLWGEAVALVVNGNTLVVAGSRPTIGNGAGVGVTTASSTANGPRNNILMTGFAVAGTTQAIDITSANAPTLGVTVDNVVVNSATNNGIRVSAASTTTSTVIIQNNTVSAATQNGFDLRTAAGAGNLLLSVSGNTITATGSGMVIDGSVAGTTTIIGFANNNITGSTAGSGIVVTSATFDAVLGNPFNVVSGGNTLIGSVGNGVGVAGMVLTTVKGDLSFTDLDIVNDNGAGLSASAAAAFVSATGTGFQIVVSNANVANITSTAGPAVSLNIVTANLPLQSIISTNSTTQGVSLVTTPGTFSAGSGSSITNPTGNAFVINGSDATVSYDGTITDDVGTVVNITNTTGGAKTFSGAITDGDDGDGSGVSLTTNSTANITFRGGLVLSTGANPAFTATGGGVVNVCDENPCNNAATGALINKLSTTSGVALNVANTNIGANNLEFRSISSSGPSSSGIILNTTGSSGGLKVKGNTAGNCGGTITVQPLGTRSTANAPVTADCTGGTITGGSPAISLNDTDNVSLTRMFIQNAGSDGINVANINGFTLANSYITDSAGAAGDRGIEMGDFATGTPVNGAITISNSTIGPTPHDNFGVGIASGTSTWSITSTVFTGSVLNSGFNHEIRAATMTSFMMDGCVLQNQFADGMQMQPASGTAGTITSATIQNSTFFGNNIGMDLNHDGTANITYKVLSNTVLSQVANSINFFTSAAVGTGGTMNGRFFNNRIGSNAIPNSGGGVGIRINVNGGADTTVLLDANVIRQVLNGRGIEIISRNGTGGTDATVTNNDVTVVDTTGFPLSSIFLQSNCLTVCNTLRSNVTGNTVPAFSPTGELINGQIALLESGASTLQLVDTTAPISGTCASELAATNTGLTAASAGCSLIAGPINTPP